MRKSGSYDFKHKLRHDRPISQFFLIALCVVRQPLERKFTKTVLCVSSRLNSYLEKNLMKIITDFLLVMGKQCGN